MPNRTARAATSALVAGVAVALAACSTGPSSGFIGRATTSVPASPSTVVVPAPTSVQATTTIPPGTSVTSAPPVDSSAAPATSNDVSAAACVAHLPLTTRVGQLLMPAVSGTELAQEADTFAAWHVGGALLMTAPPASDPTALSRFKSASAIPLLIATDEEGGDVQRLKSLGRLPAENDVPGSMTPDQAKDMIAAHARAVHDLGVDVAFAPVVDVGPDGHLGPLGNRTFSSDPNVVSAYGLAYVQGWESAGVLPVLKHFPGHGAASADSHSSFATTAPLSSLETRDLVPYQQLRTSGAGVMVGHLLVPGLTTGDRPTSVTKEAIDGLLRQQLGYEDTLVFSDSLNMNAVSAVLPSVGDAALASILAGADVAVYTVSESTPSALSRLMSAARSGELPEERLNQSVARILRAKRFDPCDVAGRA